MFDPYAAARNRIEAMGPIGQQRFFIPPKLPELNIDFSTLRVYDNVGRTAIEGTYQDGRPFGADYEYAIFEISEGLPDHVTPTGMTVSEDGPEPGFCIELGPGRHHTLSDRQFCQLTKCTVNGKIPQSDKVGGKPQSAAPSRGITPFDELDLTGATTYFEFEVETTPITAKRLLKSLAEYQDHTVFTYAFDHHTQSMALERASLDGLTEPFERLIFFGGRVPKSGGYPFSGERNGFPGSVCPDLPSVAIQRIQNPIFSRYFQFRHHVRTEPYVSRLGSAVTPGLLNDGFCFPLLISGQFLTENEEHWRLFRQFNDLISSVYPQYDVIWHDSETRQEVSNPSWKKVVRPSEPLDPALVDWAAASKDRYLYAAFGHNPDGPVDLRLKTAKVGSRSGSAS